MDKEKQFSDLINRSSKILITSHISPDPDAICSVLLLGNTLSLNYPDKKVSMVLEEMPNRDLSFLIGYDKIKFADLSKETKAIEPDLFIMVDANSFGRVSRNSGEQLSSLVSTRPETKFVIIDHHEPAGRDESDIYINNGYPAAAQEIYQLLLEEMKLQMPEGYAPATMFGIISDTYRFKYVNPKHRQTFGIISDLIDNGADIEDLENRLEAYNKNQLDVFAHLVSNIKNNLSGYTYSFTTDRFARDWFSSGKPIADFKTGTELFINQFLRNFEGNKWGFAAYQDMAAGPGNYAVSFRAQSGYKDVAAIARKLGGGGHKPAAAAKVTGKDLQEILTKVNQALSI